MKRALILIVPVCVAAFFGYLAFCALLTGKISINEGTTRNPGPITEVERSVSPALYWKSTGASLAAAAFGVGLCILVHRKTRNEN
jgi:ABC-type spermidine/putrescine transport system permease subunit I